MLKQADVQSLSALLKPGQTLTGPAQLAAYQLDAGMDQGLPEAVLLVSSTDDVQRAARWTSQHQVSLTARGAGTSYTGGAVADEGGVMLSFARLNAILEIDETSRIAILQPGLVNGALQRLLQPLGLFYPPDPASQSVCTLGGNIAENAGGPHCLKYGVTGNYVLGLEVVLPDGQVLQLGGKALDPPEYDFTSLITGSEGTLALVTAAILRLRRIPPAVQALTASFSSVAQAGEAVSSVIAASLLPATIELMDQGMISIVEDYLNAGLPRDAGAMLIIDVDGYPESLDAQLDEIAAILRQYQPLEIKIAHTPQERDIIWRARRSAAGAISRLTPNEYLVDVAVPRSRLSEVIQGINAIGREYGYRVCYLAHAGDGNLHPNLLCDFSIPGERERVLRAGGEILTYCASIGGSIGAEHGIGLEKRDYLPSMYSPREIGAMLEIKDLFDPDGLMNPGKIFPVDHSPESARLISTSSQPGAPGIPGAYFAPATPDESADGLRLLQSAQQPTYLRGGGTHWQGDAPPGTLLSSAGLAGIVKISTADMYVTARAGTTLAELQSSLAEKGFWVPLLSISPAGTLGGGIAANTNSPFRSLYGSLRDQLLAVQVALGDGRLLRFGRPLVKDVAGYQMSKLFPGSFGTLGMLTEITLKLHPLPRCRRSLLIQAPDLEHGLAWGFAALRCALICSGAVLFTASVVDKPAPGWTLVYTAEGHPADVSAELDLVRQALLDASSPSPQETGALSAAGVWERTFTSGGFLARLALPASELPQFISRLEPALLEQVLALDIAAGMLLLGCRSSQAGEILPALRQAAGPGGYAIMAAGPRPLLRQVDAWGGPPPAHDLMRGLKRRWDLADILNRGEFI